MWKKNLINPHIIQNEMLKTLNVCAKTKKVPYLGKKTKQSNFEFDSSNRFSKQQGQGTQKAVKISCVNKKQTEKPFKNKLY